MTETRAVHECLFCPLQFESSAAKDDHILEHFARETCTECNQNLIQIGGRLYTLHDKTTCINRTLKTEGHFESDYCDSSSTSRKMSQHENDEEIKSEIHSEGDFLWSETQTISEQITYSDPDTFLEKSYRIDDENHLKELPKVEENSDIPEEEMDPVCANAYQIKEEPIQFHEELIIKIDGSNIQSENQSFHIQENEHNILETSTETHIPCDICGQKLANEDLLKKHKILLHSSQETIKYKVRMRKSEKSNEKPWCDLCNKIFKSDKIRQKHMRMQHDQSIKKFKCELCHVLFMREISLQNHVCKQRKTTKSVPMPCDICGKMLGNKSSLRKHKILLHSSSETIFCKVCGRLFQHSEELEPHQSDCALKLRLRKSKKSGDLFCDLCKTEFSTDDSFRKHMRMKHDPNIEKFKCKLCCAVFMKESSLQAHNCRKLTESGEKVIFPCDFCGKELSNRDSLRTHTVLFHSPPGTIFCNVCGKLFAEINKRDIHRTECLMKNKLRKLKAYGEFECDICKKKVTRKADIRRHMRRKHDPSVENFKCKRCNFVFMKESSLQSHQCKDKSAKGKSEEPMCDICGKILSCNSSLRKHQIKFHSPSDTIYCRACIKIFPSIEELNTHQPQCLLKRYVQQPCDVCGRVLANSSSLRNHKIALHSPPGTIFCKNCFRKFTTIEELQIHTCASKERIRKNKKTKKTKKNKKS